METRLCNACGEEKSLSEEFYRKSYFIKKDGTQGISFMKRCLVCHNIWQTKNYFKNKLPKENDGYSICKYCDKKYLVSEFRTAFMCNFCFKHKKSKQDKKWREENKDEKAAMDADYRENNKDKISKQAKERYIVNKKIILERASSYRKNKMATDISFVEQERIKNNNKAKQLKRKIRRNIKRQNRRKQDPAFRLRAIISKSVWVALQKNGGSKNGNSSIKGLPYTINELQAHLESLFEPWMTWDNQGHYKVDKWDDNDPSTWTWQIDHIIPHSKFHYTSMEDKSFLDCWALSNLRPYSAKQNIIEGANRKRHKT